MFAVLKLGNQVARHLFGELREVIEIIERFDVLFARGQLPAGLGRQIVEVIDLPFGCERVTTIAVGPCRS
jgi:hypothetical protein